MITIRDITATEGSTVVATCTFTSEAGDSVIPASDVLWKLVDPSWTELDSGTVSAAASVDIVISSISLSIEVREVVWLTLIVETTYDSANGTGLPLVEHCRFPCYNLLDRP